MLPQTPGGLKLAKALLLRQEDSLLKPSPDKRNRGSSEQHSFTYGQTRGQPHHSGLDSRKGGSATQRSFSYAETHRRRERRLGTLPTLDEVILEGLSKRSASATNSRKKPEKDVAPEDAGRSEESAEASTSSRPGSGGSTVKSEKAINWKKAKALMIRSAPQFSGRGAIGEENEAMAEARPGDRPGPVPSTRKGALAEANAADACHMSTRHWQPLPTSAPPPPVLQQQRHQHHRRMSAGAVMDKSPLSIDDPLRIGQSKRAKSAPLPQGNKVRPQKSASNPARTDAALSEFFQQQLGNNRSPALRGSATERSFTFGSLDARQGQLPRGSATELTFTYGDGQERRMRRENASGGVENLVTIEEVMIRRFAMRARARAAGNETLRRDDKSIPVSHKKPPLPPRKLPPEPIPPLPSDFSTMPMSPGLSTSSSSSTNSTQEFSTPGSLSAYQRRPWYRYLVCGNLKEAPSF